MPCLTHINQFNPLPRTSSRRVITVSGYSSRREAEQVVRATIATYPSAPSHDPRDYRMGRVYEDLITGRPGYGWDIDPDESRFMATLNTWLRRRGGVRRTTKQTASA